MTSNARQHRHEVTADGTQKWYRNDKLHREDGPAIEYADGYQAWYRGGKLHREHHGPDVENVDGTKTWFRNCPQVTEDEVAGDIQRERQQKGEAFTSAMHGGLTREITAPRPLQLKPAKRPKP